MWCQSAMGLIVFRPLPIAFAVGLFVLAEKKVIPQNSQSSRKQQDLFIFIFFWGKERKCAEELRENFKLPRKKLVNVCLIFGRSPKANSAPWLGQSDFCGFQRGAHEYLWEHVG